MTDIQWVNEFLDTLKSITSPKVYAKYTPFQKRV
jgi:hypothetical protein